MQAPLLPIQFRLVEAADTNFCAKAFILGMRETPGIQAQIGQVAWPRLQFLFEELWYNDKVAWLVACDPAHPSFIHGFLVGERAETVEGGDVLVVHFVYVRQVSRRFGVARRLLERFDTRLGDRTPFHFSAITPTGREIVRRKPGLALYDPWYLWAHVGPAEKRGADQTVAMTKALKAVVKVTDAKPEAPVYTELGYRDPNPTLSTPVEDPGFEAEFKALVNDARRRGGVV
jgi:GNAT superfamily N-acetyltransferase